MARWQEHGRIDVILNNAGLMPHSPLERGKVEDWERMIDVNIKGVLYGIAAALPHMKAQMGGQIINVSSVAGHKVRAGNRGLFCDQNGGAGHFRRAAPGGQALQYPHDDHLARRSAERIARQRHRTGYRRRYPRQLRQRHLQPNPSPAMVAFAMSQPEDVDVNEILFRPTRQEY